MYQSNTYQYLEELKEEKLLICKDDKEAIQIRDVARLLGFDTFVLPDLRVSVGEDLRAYGEDLQLLFTQLSTYHACKNKRVHARTATALLVPFPKPELFAMKILEFGDSLNLNELKDTLYQWGYHFVDIAAQRGEVSFRGDIIDIYPIHRHRTSNTQHRIKNKQQL